MLSRASLLFVPFVSFGAAGIALALSSAGCSSLTEPNEIRIAAEPPPAPAAPRPAAPQQGAKGGAHGPAPAAPPGSGG